MDYLQRLEPSVRGRDELVRIGSLINWLGLRVVIVDDAIDGRLEIDDGSEDAIYQPVA